MKKHTAYAALRAQNLSRREKILMAASRAFMYASALSLRVLYRCLFGWGRYRGFELGQIVMECSFEGVRKSILNSPTPETDRRVELESRALSEFLIPHEEAIRALTFSERNALMRERRVPTDLAAEKDLEALNRFLE